MPELEAPLVNGRRGGRLLFGVGPDRAALPERTLVHPPWLGAAASGIRPPLGRGGCPFEWEQI